MQLVQSEELRSYGVVEKEKSRSIRIHVKRLSGSETHLDHQRWYENGLPVHQD